MGKRPIVVVGSINMDLVVRVERIPVIGETISGIDFETHPGGKGTNQAAAVARLGQPVHMIGRVGSDAYGTVLRRSLHDSGVDVTSVAVSEGSSGVAIIAVAEGGENSIIVTPGANALLSPEDLDANLELMRSAAMVLTQLEIPLATVQHLAQICEREGLPLMLDPAPVSRLPVEVLRAATWITPNEIEVRQINNSTALSASEDELARAAESIIELGPRNVLLKMGARGAYLATHDGVRASIPAYPVKAADTTAAGDAFNGAFAVALGRGACPQQAAEFATAAAAISVTRHGALPSMPTRAEVEEFLEEQTREGRALKI
ncbi:MAG TPA: ribokinase [Acidobacteriaceae bacterium]|jgi:ribokinase